MVSTLFAGTEVKGTNVAILVPLTLVPEPGLALKHVIEPKAMDMVHWFWFPKPISKTNIT